MKKDKTVFERYAKSLVELVLDSSMHDKVFEDLCRQDPKIEKIGRSRVFEEYVPAKLALGCCYWNGCCDGHQLGDKELRNVFFKEVMRRFESPKSLAVAARFGEALYAANSHPDEAPSLAILTHLFEKLDISRMGGESGAGIAPAFLFMMEVCDALKSVFENEFDDFMYADETHSK